MTASETRQMVGDTISVTYFNGSDYVDTTARYVNSNSSSGYPEALVGGSPAIVNGQSFVYYRFDANDISDSMSYITCDLSFDYSFYDAEFFYTWIMFSHGYGGTTVSSTYQSPSVDGYFAGNSFHVENSQVLNGFHDWLKVQIPDYNLQGEYVPLELSSQTATSGYVTRAVFCGGSSSYYGAHYICIACPYVSSSAYGSQGIFTETSATSSGSGDINVNVDMSETNGLLGTLISAVQSLGSFILDGLQSLFVPSESAISAFKNRLDTLLHDTFGAVYDAQELTDSAVRQILTASAVDSVRFDGTTVDVSAIAGAGAVVQFPAMTVPLKPEASKLSLLYSTLAKILDIVCTIAVLNMLRTKFDAIIFGEKVVDSYAD